MGISVSGFFFMTDFHLGHADDQHSIGTYNTDGLLNNLGKGLVIAESPHDSSRALNNSQKKSYSKRKFLILREGDPSIQLETRSAKEGRLPHACVQLKTWNSSQARLKG